MKKQRFLVVMAILLVPWLLAGCGIAQEQYDAVTSQLTSAQQELQSVKSESQTAQTRISELTESLRKAETELDAVQAELEKTEAEVQSTQTELESALAEVESAQAENSEMTSNLEKTQTELDKTKSEYETFAFSVEAEWNLLDGYMELNHYVLGVNDGILQDDLDTIYRQSLKISGLLGGYQTYLSTLWESAFVDSGDEWNLYYEPFVIFMEEVAKLISQRAELMRDIVPSTSKI